MGLLDEAQIQAFHTEGYLVFEKFFDENACVGYRADIDALKQPLPAENRRPLPVEMPHLGPLISHPRVMDIVTSLMGPGAAFHHLHAVRQDAGTPGVHWHQDYEQFPQANRSHVMAHFFYYFNGLNGEIGDLLVLPKSQHLVIANDALRLLGTESLPGTVCVDNLPPGSAVVVHSALWHARRAKPGGAEHPRYFADASYCQAGIRWPSYGNRNWRDMLAKAREHGLDPAGRHAHLFDESHFFDEPTARNLVKESQGSLILSTQEWQE